MHAIWGLVDILVCCTVALSAPSKKAEIEGRLVVLGRLRTKVNWREVVGTAGLEGRGSVEGARLDGISSA